MGPHLDARLRFAMFQRDNDGTALFGVVDMDRKKAAPVGMNIEQRQLLVHDIASAIEIQNDRRRLMRIGRQRWLHKFGRHGEWNFCLKTGRLMPANQEKR